MLEGIDQRRINNEEYTEILKIKKHLVTNGMAWHSVSNIDEKTLRSSSETVVFIVVTK